MGIIKKKKDRRMAREYEKLYPLTDEAKQTGLGDFLSIELNYALGGINFMSGRSERRGLYVHITPIQVDTYSRTMTLFGDNTGNNFPNGKVFVKEMKRASQKQMDLMWDGLDKDYVAENIISGNKDKALSYLYDILDNGLDAANEKIQTEAASPKETAGIPSALNSDEAAENEQTQSVSVKM